MRCCNSHRIVQMGKKSETLGQRLKAGLAALACLLPTWEGNHVPHFTKEARFLFLSLVKVQTMQANPVLGSHPARPSIERAARAALLAAFVALPLLSSVPEVASQKVPGSIDPDWGMCGIHLGSSQVFVCPNAVCCSQFGFCGNSHDHCAMTAGCQPGSCILRHCSYESGAGVGHTGPPSP